MKTFKVIIHFRYIADGSIEKDHDTHEVEALSIEHAKSIVSDMYGSKYIPFKIEVVEVMTKNLLFKITNPSYVKQIQKN